MSEEKCFCEVICCPDVLCEVNLLRSSGQHTVFTLRTEPMQLDPERCPRLRRLITRRLVKSGLKLAAEGAYDGRA